MRGVEVSFVWSFVVLFVSCMCVCDLFLFDRRAVPSLLLALAA